MKKNVCLLFVILCFGFTGCDNKNDSNEILQKEVESLKEALSQMATTEEKLTTQTQETTSSDIPSVNEHTVFNEAEVSLSNESSYKPAMTLAENNKEYVLNVNAYNYFMSMYKTLFLANYGMDADSADIWTTEYTTVNYPSVQNIGDMVKIQIIDIIENMIAAEAAFDANGLTLTEDELNDIELAIKELVNSDKYGKSAKTLENNLSKFSLTIDLFKQVRATEKKYSKLNDYYFNASTGQVKFTDEEIKEQYLFEFADYVRIKHVLFTTPEAKAKADNVVKQVTEEGKVFEDFLELSEDPGTANNPDGYVFARKGDYVEEFENAAFDMEIGEVRVVKTLYGYHVMKKYNMEDVFETYKSEVLSYMQADIFEELLQPLKDKIVTVEDNISKIKISSIPTFFGDMELISQ